MAATALAVQLFMTGDDDIIVTEDWRPQPGEPMPQMPGCFVGKRFGAGALAMNQIYDIVDERGDTADLALKVCKPTLAARRSLAHEWKMFKDLSLLANEFAAARTHFLQADRVVRLGDGKIAGIVMEKANGQNVSKTLKNPKFCNVRYVIALLRDLLVGLDVAQRVLGFAHYDLKLDNVIEHWGNDAEEGKARLMIDAVPQFKIFDFGTAVVYPDPFAVHRVVDDHLERHHPDAAPQMAEQHPHNRRGKVDTGRDTASYEYSTPFLCVRLYHMWWKQRGDVFRVLSALCKHLDDRTWPLEDLELVNLLLTVLEHTTNSKHLKARFEPRALLLHKLYGPHPPAAVVRHSPPPTSSSINRQQTLNLIQQHSQLVLQGNTAAARLASQGSSLLPSVAAIEACSRFEAQQQQQQQQQMRQRQHKHVGPLGVVQPHLQGVAEVEREEGEEPPAAPIAAPVAAALTGSAAPVLRINTTKISTGPVAASSSSTSTAAAAGGDRRHMQHLQPPPSPTGMGGLMSSSGGGGGGQYTPRRSTEVSREELSSSVVTGMSYARLAKASDTPAAAAGVEGGAFGSSPAAAGAPQTPPANIAAPPSPFAGSGVQQGGQPVGNSVWGQQGGGGGGVQQMVSNVSPEQRRRQQQKISAPLLLQQHQHEQQPTQHHQTTAVSSTGAPDAAHNTWQQHNQHSTAANTGASTGTHTAAGTPSHSKPAAAAAAAAPAGASETGAFAAPPPGVSSGAPPALRTSGDTNNTSAAHRLDGAATIVAKQPVAPAAQQSVLGSRKALRGVTAQQLLVEPVIQRLLSKV